MDSLVHINQCLPKHPHSSGNYRGIVKSWDKKDVSERHKWPKIIKEATSGFAFQRKSPYNLFFSRNFQSPKEQNFNSTCNSTL